MAQRPRQIRTTAIVLSRTDFGEADRILTFLTPDKGKVRAIAKAVRKQKSKLAGGIELFSVSDISYIIGRGDISTLVSTRLITYYGNIVKDMDRTNTAYECIRLLDRATEENTEADYFEILEEAFKSLDNDAVAPELTQLWFKAQLLRLSGHTPNLHEDETGQKLDSAKTYDFDFERMAFLSPSGREGAYAKDHIKFLRLCFSYQLPGFLQRISGSEELIKPAQVLVQNLATQYLRS